MENVITVTKTVKRQVPPDTAEISIVAQGEGRRCSAAVAECSRIEKAVCELAQKLGVTVKCSDMQVSPVCRDGKTVSYRAVKPLTVCEKLPFDYDGLIDGLGELQVGWHIGFERNDRAEISRQLVRDAVKGAIADAEIIADAAGVKLGALYGVEYSPSCSPVLLRAARADVELQPIEISETVVCSFKIA